jgi:hypothetical protein
MTKKEKETQKQLDAAYDTIFSLRYEREELYTKLQNLEDELWRIKRKPPIELCQIAYRKLAR